MPKRWKVATVVTLTELEAGQEVDSAEFESREYTEREEEKAKTKFRNVKENAKKETDEKD